MTPGVPAPLSLEDLAELYRLLKGRVERLIGMVEQLRAEGNRNTLAQPTWRDFEALKKDVAELQQQIAAKRGK